MDRVLNDRYELRQHAARGGMADVYHGWDRRLSREVAIKVLRPELSADDEYVDRFRDEARTAARLAHPISPPGARRPPPATGTAPAPCSPRWSRRASRSWGTRPPR